MLSKDWEQALGLGRLPGEKREIEKYLDHREIPNKKFLEENELPEPKFTEGVGQEVPKFNSPTLLRPQGLIVYHVLSYLRSFQG